MLGSYRVTPVLDFCPSHFLELNWECQDIVTCNLKIFWKFIGNSLRHVRNPSRVKSKLPHAQLRLKFGIFNLSPCNSQWTVTPLWRRHDRLYKHMYLFQNGTYQCYSDSFSKSGDGNRNYNTLHLGHFAFSFWSYLDHVAIREVVQVIVFVQGKP